MMALSVIQNIIQNTLPGAVVSQDTAFDQDVDGMASALHISHSSYEFVAIVDRNQSCSLMASENDFFDCKFQFESLVVEVFTAHLLSAVNKTAQSFVA